MTEAFDQSLTKTADVLLRPAGGDAYGAQSNNLQKVGTVACRVSLGKGRPHEAKTPRKAANNYREVFMRPWYSDQAPDASFARNHVIGSTTYNTKPLTHKNWLQIDGQLYDITQVDNPGEQDHHFEVWCELIVM